MARTTIDLEATYPHCNHTNRSQPISALDTLVNNKATYAAAWDYVNLVLNPPGDKDAFFNSLKVVSAAALDGVWQGNGAGFTPGVMCTSRNTILLPRGGPFLVNFSIPCSFGGIIGKGTNVSGTNGNDTSYLQYDHAGWIEPGADRAVVKSVNWGTSTYLESAYMDGFRINGAAGQWRDPSYNQYGMLVRMMGETCNIATDRGIYVHDCNNDGVHIYGAGPGNIGDITAFDNNQAGLRVRNTNSLGGLSIARLSCDNNGYAFYTDQAGGFNLRHLKCETGLSNARSKAFKAQVGVFAKGWVAGTIDLFTSAVTGVIDAPIHFWSTANGSKLMVHMFEGWNHENLVIDHRGNRRFYMAGNATSYRAMSIVVRGLGTSTSVAIDDPANTSTVPISPLTAQFNSGGDRLGVVASAAQYQYTASPATPPWDDTNGGSPPPPPPSPTVTTISVSVNPSGVQSGQTSQATAVVYDQFGQVMTGQTVTWSISSGPATVNSSGVVTTTNSGSVVVQATIGAVSGSATITVTAAPPPPPNPGGQLPAIIVVNSADAGSAALATSYRNAWGISAGHVITVNIPFSGEATSDAAAIATARNAIRAHATTMGAQVAQLCFRYPTKYTPDGDVANSAQSITDALEFGVNPVGAYRVSTLYNYTGETPYTSQGILPCMLLFSAAQIKRSAHGTRPTGEIYVLAAKDQNSGGNPRGTTRMAGLGTIGSRADVTIFDNRNDARVGSGNNSFNNLTTALFTLKNKVPAPACCPNPGPARPVIAYFGSIFTLSNPTDLTYPNGWGAEHLTSYGAWLPGATVNGFPFTGGGGQTTFEFFTNRTVGASWTGGCVSEPNINLADQFIRPSIFVPMWKPNAADGTGGGKANVLCMTASIRMPGRYLKVGDALCAPFQ